MPRPPNKKAERWATPRAQERARDREKVMIVAMQENATEEQIDAVISAMEEAGVDVHRTTGEFQTILAGVGPTAGLDLTKFEMLPGVLHVHRISAPYKLAGRAWRPEGTVVEFTNGATIGGQQVAIIAGPCADRKPRADFRDCRVRQGRGRRSFCAAEPTSRAARRIRFRGWAFRAWN